MFQRSIKSKISRNQIRNFMKQICDASNLDNTFLLMKRISIQIISNTHQQCKRRRLYSVVVITFGFDPNNPGSNPGTTYIFLFVAKARCLNFFFCIKSLVSKFWWAQWLIVGVVHAVKWRLSSVQIAQIQKMRTKLVDCRHSQQPHVDSNFIFQKLDSFADTVFPVRGIGVQENSS